MCADSPQSTLPEDYDTAIWAGVLPARLTLGAAEPETALRPGVNVPDHISAFARRLILCPRLDPVAGALT